MTFSSRVFSVPLLKPRGRVHTMLIRCEREGKARWEENLLSQDELTEEEKLLLEQSAEREKKQKIIAILIILYVAFLVVVMFCFHLPSFAPIP